RDERGKAYQVFQWAPRKKLSADKVEAYFDNLGACGNIPAFMAWIASAQPIGAFTTITRTQDALLLPQHVFSRWVPTFHSDPEHQGVGLTIRSEYMPPGWIYVAFREVKNP